MAVCASGSTTKPGVDSSIVVTPAFMQSIFPPFWGILIPYLPYVSNLNIGNVGAFCATDPPELTWPDADDFLQLLNGVKVGGALLAEQFIHDVVRRYLWDGLCMCTSGTPTYPSNPTPPSDLPALNPPAYVQPPSSSECAVYESTYQEAQEGGWGNLIGQRQTAAYTGDPNTGDGLPLPTGVTSLAITAMLPSRTGDSFTQASVVFATYKPDRTVQNGGLIASIAEGSTRTATLTVTQPSVAVAAWYSDDGSSPPLSLSEQPIVTIRALCGSSGFAQTACCPPDTIATGYLSQILAMVTLVQRQIAPFATIDGASHSGLTGSGELSVQGLIGARITITDALPGQLGVEAGDPEAVFGAGWVNWGTTSGFAAREFLGSTTTLSFPPAVGVYTRLGYSLPPGVEATIVELVREP